MGPIIQACFGESPLIQAVKIKLSLSAEDQRSLDGQSKILNWADNQLLSRAKAKLESLNDSSSDKTQTLKLIYSKRGLRDLIPMMKEEHPFLKTVHSSPLKNAALRLSEAIAASSAKRNKRRKFPRFRSQRQKWFSLLYDESGKGFKILKDRLLKLSLGQDENKKRLYVTAQLEKSLESFGMHAIRQLRITKEKSGYFAVFTVERADPQAKPIRKIIAIDPNHKNLGYGVSSTGLAVEIHNPYFIKSLDKQIDSVKRRRDLCKRRSTKIELESGKVIWKPSRRWEVFQNKLEKLYIKRQEQTKSFLFTMANKLYKNFSTSIESFLSSVTRPQSKVRRRQYKISTARSIFDENDVTGLRKGSISVGDYTPNGGGTSTKMRRAMNNQSLIGRFKLVLNWVAKKSGKHFHEWNEKGSTRTCHACGFKHERSLSPEIREWSCPGCNMFHIRDENAALNGLMRTQKEFELFCSNHPAQVTARCAWRFNGLGFDRGLLAEVQAQT
jgi:putative transposase